MDKKEFKIILQECLINNGFTLKNKNYYNSTSSLLIVVSTQRSNYDNIFFINYAIFVKEIHIGVDYPKVQEGDIRGRFQYDRDGRILSYYPLTELNKFELQKNLNDNIQAFLNPLIEGGLKRYFEMYPKAIYTATKGMKDFLNNNLI